MSSGITGFISQDAGHSGLVMLTFTHVSGGLSAHATVLCWLRATAHTRLSQTPQSNLPGSVGGRKEGPSLPRISLLRTCTGVPEGGIVSLLSQNWTEETER